MVRKIETVPVMFYYELTEEQSREARTMYSTEEASAEQVYIYVFDTLIPLERFTRIRHDYYHASMHLTNSSTLAIRMHDCGTQVEVELIIN